MKLFPTGLGLILVTPLLAGAQQPEVDQRLPAYEPTTGVSGDIKVVGSDTMNTLMALWTGGFREHYPNVVVEVEGKGSGTAPPALIAGTATFGPMSRPMKPKEVDEFTEEFGYEPTGIATSIDMLAVYVHRDNPIRGLTIEQVDAIFSQTRRGGYAEDITTWGQLGLTGDWADKPISIYGRDTASGTYGYFKDNALFKGDFKASVKTQPGSAAVVSSVANDKYAIGYSGIGYMTADVRAVPLKHATDPEFVEALAEHAYSGAYPLARFLFLYLNKAPREELDPLRREFLTFVLSEEGQTFVAEDGYLPITGPVAKRELAKVGVTIELDELRETAEPAEAGAPARGH